MRLYMRRRKEIICVNCFQPMHAMITVKYCEVPIDYNPAGECYNFDLESGHIVDEEATEFYCDDCGVRVIGVLAIQGAEIMEVNVDDAPIKEPNEEV